MAKTRGGGRSDTTRLNARGTTLTDITLGPTLFERGITSTIGMALEHEVDVVMGALYGRLVVRAKAVVLSGKLQTVGEHVDLGFHDFHIAILDAFNTAVPRVSNENDQLRELGDLAAVHRRRG